MRVGDPLFFNETPPHLPFNVMGRITRIQDLLVEVHLVDDLQELWSGPIVFEREGSSWDQAGLFKREPWDYHPKKKQAEVCFSLLCQALLEFSRRFTHVDSLQLGAPLPHAQERMWVVAPLAGRALQLSILGTDENSHGSHVDIEILLFAVEAWDGTVEYKGGLTIRPWGQEEQTLFFSQTSLSSDDLLELYKQLWRKIAA